MTIPCESCGTYYDPETTTGGFHCYNPPTRFYTDKEIKVLLRIAQCGRNRLIKGHNDTCQFEVGYGAYPCNCGHTALEEALNMFANLGIK